VSECVCVHIFQHEGHQGEFVCHPHNAPQTTLSHRYNEVLRAIYRAREAYFETLEFLLNSKALPQVLSDCDRVHDSTGGGGGDAAMRFEEQLGLLQRAGTGHPGADIEVEAKYLAALRAELRLQPSLRPRWLQGLAEVGEGEAVGESGGERSEVLKRLLEMEALICAQLGENKYATTMHVIANALQKLAAPPATLVEGGGREGEGSTAIGARRAWRGLCGQRLPASLRGVGEGSGRGCVAVELSFCSLTLDIEVALRASETGAVSDNFPVLGLIEVELGSALDRGALLAWVSQFPKEHEVAFPPLATVEIYAQARLYKLMTSTGERWVQLYKARVRAPTDTWGETENAGSCFSLKSRQLGVKEELNHEIVLLVSCELKMRLALLADAGADPQRLGKAGAFADAILRGVRDVLAIGADRTAANTWALAAMDEGAKGGYTQAPGEVLKRHLLTAAAFREEEKRKEDQRVVQSNQTRCLQMLEAAEEGQADVCAELLRQGCSVNFAPRSGATALHRASANGHLSTVTLLIDAKADVTALDTAGASAFDKAFVRRKRDVLSALVQQGRGAQDAEAQLLRSISDSNIAAVQLLLDVAPDTINIVDARMETPLHISVTNCDEQLVGLLLERGADVNGGVPNAEERVPKAEESGDGGGDVKGGAGDAGGAGAGALEGEGNGGGGGVDERKTPLTMAVEKDHAGIMKMLLDAGADVGRRGAVSGMTALHTACALGSESAVDMLLAALIRRKDKTVLGIEDGAGNNAVHTSVLSGNLDILQKVLVCCKAGGDEINALNKDGVSPVYLACQGASGGGMDEDLAKALVSRGADKSVVREEFPEFSFLQGPNVEVEDVDVDVDLESAAVKIQSLARGKRDRERVKNLKGLDGEGEGGEKEGAAGGDEVQDGLQAQLLNC